MDDATQPTTSPSKPSSRAPTAIVRNVFTFARGEIQYAVRVVVESHFAPPPRALRVRRFFYGVALPFAVLAATLRTPAIRARYLRVTAVQMAVLIPPSVLYLAESDRITQALESSGHSPLSATIAVITAIVSTLSIIEWCIIALSRQHHELLAAMAAATTGVPWEPLRAPPRIELDIRWLAKKLKRRARGLLLFASAFPLLWLLTLIPLVGDVLYAVGTALWGGYWLSVFALANTASAWWYASPKGPWLPRVLDTPGKVPVIGWPARVYAGVLRTIMTPVEAACTSFEQAPYEAAGLAAARAICGIPGIYMFVRPVLGVAAAHVMLSIHRTSGTPLPPPDRVPPQLA